MTSETYAGNVTGCSEQTGGWDMSKNKTRFDDQMSGGMQPNH